ncbi:MAG TPA: hypothetical protein VGD95_08070 [Micavibrio sp.]
MANKSKGFKAANGGASSGFKATGAEKSKIAELPRSKFNIPWRWLTALAVLPVAFHMLSQDEPTNPQWKPSTDTAPKQTSHHWLDKMNKRNAERAAEGLPPLKRAGARADTAAAIDTTETAPTADSRVQERRDREARLRAEEALPGGPGVDARRGGFKALFNQLYNLPPRVTAEVDRMMAHRDPGQALYDVVTVDQTQKFHIASAAVDNANTVNSFVCVEDNRRVKDFYHAQTAPTGNARYSVAINEGIPHKGNYMTGVNLMEQFGDKNCADGLRRLHQAMNGTGETDALNKSKSLRDSERRFNDRGLKGQY